MKTHTITLLAALTLFASTLHAGINMPVLFAPIALADTVAQTTVQASSSTVDLPAAPTEDESLSVRILGHWVNTTAHPTRIATFHSDGTFHVDYVGSTKTVDGTWRITDHTLFRYFPDHTRNAVAILELNSSSMALRTDYMSPTGPAHQVDHYVRQSAHRR